MPEERPAREVTPMQFLTERPTPAGVTTAVHPTQRGKVDQPVTDNRSREWDPADGVPPVGYGSDTPLNPEGPLGPIRGAAPPEPAPPPSPAEPTPGGEPPTEPAAPGDPLDV